MQPTVTWTNNRVALAKDLIFGLCVFGENADGSIEWIPVDTLDLEDVQMVHDLVDYTPGCPYQEDLNKILKAKKENAA